MLFCVLQHLHTADKAVAVFREAVHLLSVFRRVTADPLHIVEQQPLLCNQVFVALGCRLADPGIGRGKFFLVRPIERLAHQPV